MSIELKSNGFVRTSTVELPRHWSVSNVEGTLVIDENIRKGFETSKLASA